MHHSLLGVTLPCQEIRQLWLKSRAKPISKEGKSKRDLLAHLCDDRQYTKVLKIFGYTKKERHTLGAEHNRIPFTNF